MDVIILPQESYFSIVKSKNKHMKNFTKFILMVTFVVSFTVVTYAQTVEVSGQLRPRYEMRNGYSTLIPEGTQAANFISQRTRLNFGFLNDVFQIGFSVQNVLTWGETTTLSKTSTNGTMLNEAWGQVKINDMISLKVGRQQISYDNQRIFGSVDWAQQSRRHDAAIVKIKPKDECQIDVGLAYNALNETNTLQYYSINNYKALQFAHWHRILNEFTVSALFLNNGLPYESFSDTTSSGNEKEKIAYSQTFGSRGTYGNDKLQANAAFYFQTGKTTADSTNDGVMESTKKVAAFYFATEVSLALNDLFSLGLGLEFLSGNSMKENNNMDNAFKPLYGTNHKFNGFMDYFYVGNYMNGPGLLDIYVPLKFKKDKFSAALTPHLFMSTAQIYGMDSDGIAKDFSNFLGTEFDLVFSYEVAKSVKISAGYSQMIASESMNIVKSVPNPKGNQDWAWIMVDIKPTFFKTKKDN